MDNSRAFLAAIWVAVISFLGTVIQSFNESRIAVQQEERRLQSELIIRAVETDKPTQALKNLRFLLKTGLVDSENTALLSLVESGEVKANFSSSEAKAPERQIRIVGRPPTEAERKQLEALEERLRALLNDNPR